MPTRVETDWSFNPNSGYVASQPRDVVVIKYYYLGLYGPHKEISRRPDFLFEIGKDTRLDRGAWEAWWGKGPVAITHDGPTSNNDADKPVIVKALKIESAPKDGIK